MEIKWIEPDSEAINAIITPGIRNLKAEDNLETVYLGGFEQDRLVCFAVFSRRLNEDPSEIYLEYLYTIPDSRDAGRCRTFVDACSAYLAEFSVRYILVKYCLVPDAAIGFNGLMRGCRFTPLNLTGRLLHYNSRDLKRRGAIQMILKNRDNLPPVECFERAGEDIVLSYLRKRGSIPVFSYAIDTAFSQVFINNNEVDAAIVASSPDGETLYISALYMDDIAKQKNMFLSLFSECLDAASRKLNDDFDIYFQLGDESIVQNLLTVFNPPDEEYMILEYMLCTNS